MRYLVMDSGRTVHEEVEATSPRQARELAKRQIRRGWVGELEVYVREDPLKGNKAGTEEFFGARPPIIL
jgi:hypothetical protein